MDYHWLGTYIAQLSVTLCVVYVWARVSLAKGELEPLPLPLVFVLFTMWGVKFAPDVLGAIGKGIGG